MKYMCRHVIQLCNDRPRQDDTDTRGGIQEGGERWKRERREEKRSGMKVVREVDGSYSKKSPGAQSRGKEGEKEQTSRTHDFCQAGTKVD